MRYFYSLKLKTLIMYHPDLHHRRSIRLPDYDYSQQGLYFVTICVQDRECLFGKIDESEMILNEIGKIVRNEWLKTAELRPNVKLHEFVVMPNHFHAIL
jgi:REP element-mobilizing transposase RayT